MNPEKVEEFIKRNPSNASMQIAMMVDASIIFTGCLQTPGSYRGFDLNHFQAIDVCEFGPSLEEFRDHELEEVENLFKDTLEFLGAELIHKDGDSYWKIDLNDPYKSYWLDQVLSDVMNLTYGKH